MNGKELLARNKKRRKLRNSKRTPTERIFNVDLPKVKKDEQRRIQDVVE